jgi:hypothetical protein
VLRQHPSILGDNGFADECGGPEQQESEGEGPPDSAPEGGAECVPAEARDENANKKDDSSHHKKK